MQATRAVDPRLEIVASGAQVHVMAFEIYVLAIVNELYFRRFDQTLAFQEERKRLRAKIARLRAFETLPAPPPSSARCHGSSPLPQPSRKLERGHRGYLSTVPGVAQRGDRESG